MRKFRQIAIYFYCSLWGVFLLSCTKESDNKLFEILSESATQIDFKNSVVENDSINILEYLSAYNGAGIGAGDFNNDGLIDLYFVSNQQANKLFINLGDFIFEDVTKKAMVGGLSGITTWSNGVTLVDINDDGWLDIYVCLMHGYLGLKGVNQLFINNGDGTFSESAKTYGLNISSYAQHAAFFDFDKDGDLDMYLLNQAIHTKESFKSAENRNVRDPNSGDRLFENNLGKFTDVSEQAGIYGGAMGYGLAVSTGDINQDGWPDIFISNDFHENDYLYYNQGDGTFNEQIRESMGHLSKSSMGNDIADWDNDGDIDIMTLDMKPPEEVMAKQTSGVDPYPVHQYKLEVGYYDQFSRNMFQENLGTLFSKNVAQFSELGQLLGVADTDWSWSAVMADLDNDGLKDLYVTNGIPKRPNSLDYRKLVNENTSKAEATPSDQLIAIMPEGPYTNVVFKNSGERFVDVSTVWGLDFLGFSNGAILADLDNDGDLDIAVNNLNAKAVVFKNQTSETTKRKYVKIALSRNGHRHIGSDVKLEVTSGNSSQFQELKSTSGWLSSYVGDHIFGLYEADNIKVRVIWPDQKEQSIVLNSLSTAIELKYEEASASLPRKILDYQPLFTHASDSSGINFIHQENNYNDFSVEPLIPHFLSTQGPKMAVGDMNGDEVDDFFIGGAKGQAGKVFMGGSHSSFQEMGMTAFNQHKFCEDAGAELMDVDNDGDLDLYVVSGGGEPTNAEFLQDRLYFNDGKGNFILKKDALPDVRSNGSCVVPLDINSDGFADLFVGGRSMPGQYGISGESKLLVNRGDGSYNNETKKFLPEEGKIGMVTDAAWNAQTGELIVVGEWMPISIFTFKRNTYTVHEITNSSGFWNTLLAEDLEGDGDLDFLVGNAGLNTDMIASPDHPVDLYVKDFDRNFTLDPIMVYQKNGKRWVYPSMDELVMQMPALRGVFPVYSLYASKTFDEIFPPQLIENSTHAQIQTLAHVLIENTEKGYIMKELPLKLQISPVFGFAVKDFDQDGWKDILAVGNLYDYRLSIGKQDASYGGFLKGKGKLTFEFVEPIKSGFSFKGEARDIKIISDSDKNRLILISRNSNSVCLFK